MDNMYMDIRIDEICKTHNQTQILYTEIVEMEKESLRTPRNIQLWPTVWLKSKKKI